METDSRLALSCGFWMCSAERDSHETTEEDKDEDNVPNSSLHSFPLRAITVFIVPLLMLRIAGMAARPEDRRDQKEEYNFKVFRDVLHSTNIQRRRFVVILAAEKQDEFFS